MFRPFFLNSNFITSQKSLSDYKSLMTTIAGNTGNSYITYALLKELGISKLEDEYHIQSIHHFDFSKSDAVAEFINANVSHVFFILQDQIRIEESYGLKLPYNNIISLLEKIEKPVIVVGLGANCFTGFSPDFYKQLDESLVRFLHYLSNRCFEIGCRGEYTIDVLNSKKKKNVTPVGCPSYFENGAERIVNKKNVIDAKKILFTSNYPNKLCSENFQVCQDEYEGAIVKAISFSDVNEFSNATVLKQISLAKYINKRYVVFPNIYDWKNFVKDFDFSIGYRLHGCILSLNSGIVSVCCNGDSRAAEMCSLLKIPYMPNLDPNTDLVNLYDKIDVSELNNAYASLYDSFNSFIFRNCGIKIFESSIPDIKQPSLRLYEHWSENTFNIISTVQNMTDTKIEEQRILLESQGNKIKDLNVALEKQQNQIDDQQGKISDLTFRIDKLYGKVQPILKNYNRIQKTFCFKILQKLFHLYKKMKSSLLQKKK